MTNCPPGPERRRGAHTDAEYVLERAALDRARGERQVIDAVVAAHASGAPRQKIGGPLSTSAQAAQQRFGPAADSV